MNEQDIVERKLRELFNTRVSWTIGRLLFCIRLAEDLNVYDSDMVELRRQIESEFKITLSDTKMDLPRTFGDCVCYVKSQLLEAGINPKTGMAITARQKAAYKAAATRRDKSQKNSGPPQLPAGPPVAACLQGPEATTPRIYKVRVERSFIEKGTLTVLSRSQQEAKATALFDLDRCYPSIVWDKEPAPPLKEGEGCQMGIARFPGCHYVVSATRNV